MKPLAFAWYTMLLVGPHRSARDDRYVSQCEHILGSCTSRSGVEKTHALWSVSQAECEGIPLNPDYQHLHNELWARQTAAIERATSAALAAAAEARDAASRHMPAFEDSTSRVRSIGSYVLKTSI